MSNAAGRRTGSPAQSHPRLFFSAADIPALRKRAESGIHQTILRNMIATAERRWDWELYEPRLVPPTGAAIRTPDGRQDWDPNYTRPYVDQYRTAQIVRNHAELYSLLWVLTQEPRFLDKAKQWVLGPCRWDPQVWAAYQPATRPLSSYPEEELQQMEHSGGAVVDTFTNPSTGVEYPVVQDTGIFTSFKLRGLAIAYDWLYPHLTEAERDLLRSTLIREAGRLYRHVHAGKAMLIHRLLNHTWFDVSQFGITSASLYFDHPQAQEWLRFARDQFVDRLLPRSLGRDGEFPEAGAYVQEYALFNAGVFFEALRSTTGEDLLIGSDFSKVPEFLLNAWSPTDGTGFDEDMTGFDLAEGLIYGFRPLMLRFAARMRNPHYQWYALHEGMAEPGADVGKRYPGYIHYSVERDYPGAWEYLWCDPAVPIEPPRVEKASAHLRDLGWVALRSGWEPNASFLMLRGGTSVGPHDRLDQNKFILYAKGERLAEHVHGPNYIYFEHFKYTPASNTILVDGLGQVVTISNGHDRFEAEYKTDNTPGRIVRFESHRHFDYAVSDASKAYGDRLTKFVRHTVFLKPDCFVILDDLASREPVSFEWLLHSYGKIAVEGSTITVAKPGARLEAQVVWPSPPKFEFRLSPPDYNKNQVPYMAVSSQNKTAATRFLVVLSPLYAHEKAPSVEATSSNGRVNVELAAEKVRWRVSLDLAKPSAEVSRAGAR